MGPLLPHFRYQPALLEELFASLAATGVKSVYVEHMNLKSYIKKRLWETLQHESAEAQAVYSDASTTLHREVLNDMIADLIEKYKLTLKLNEVLYHNKDMHFYSAQSSF